MQVDEEMESFKHLFKCTYEIEVKSFPQIIVDEKYLGPYSELVKQLRYDFDYEKLHEITKTITENLNRVIDVNFYPTEKTRRSNMQGCPHHRDGYPTGGWLSLGSLLALVSNMLCTRFGDVGGSPVPIVAVAGGVDRAPRSH